MPRPQRLLALLLLLPLVNAACASAPAAEPVTPATQAAQDFPTATAFVLHLASLAMAGEEAALDATIDAAFAERLPSGVALLTVFGDGPPGCEPGLSEGPGYNAIAIPPPMVDDSEEDAARIEALIEELSATTEVAAICTIAGEEADETLVLYTIAVRRDAAGWHTLAWRDHRRD